MRYGCHAIHEAIHPVVRPVLFPLQIGTVQAMRCVIIEVVMPVQPAQAALAHLLWNRRNAQPFHDQGRIFGIRGAQRRDTRRQDGQNASVAVKYIPDEPSPTP